MFEGQVASLSTVQSSFFNPVLGNTCTRQVARRITISHTPKDGASFRAIEIAGQKQGQRLVKTRQINMVRGEGSDQQLSSS